MAMKRRTFLWTGAIAIGTLPAGCRPWMRRVETPEPGPSDHQKATLAAMAETFIPSSDGSPGARESDALALVLDPAYPVAGYVSELVSDLDDWCYVRHFGAFVGLSPAKREQALEERMGLRGRLIASWYRPVYEGVLALAKLSFFGGLTRAVGTTFTEFPGASAGYAATSAAGVYRADGDAVMVAGAGNVSSVRVTALGALE
ncbi:MAG: gluconate 2-dehydrogenase subunit 3 family protein, partial [Deltaproteobacteria bacterium]|nr:gluconate 2-dehydrogenase subunit 3 family protein [Kofleriaceae bacterium]